MNRRGFLESIIKTGAACAILPSALTYARKWPIYRLTQADLDAVKALPNSMWITSYFLLQKEWDEVLIPPTTIRYSCPNGVWIRHPSTIEATC